MMKVKQAALLAAIGTVLTILPVVLNFFIPFNRTFLISNLIRTMGNILIAIFFYVFLIRQQETTFLKIPGVLGLIGYLLIIILNISGTIINSIFYIAMKDPLKHRGLMNIAYMLSRANFLIGLIPIVLILICFMIFHKNLNKKSHLKKVALLALIGQFISLAEWIIVFILNMFLIEMLYQRVGAGGLAIIGTLELIIRLIPPILLAIFFIVLYRVLDSKENRMQLDIGS